MEVAVLNRTAGRVPASDVRQLVQAAARAFPDAGRISIRLRHITVVFTTPRESRRLKRKFLHRDAPANVLSFRYGAEGELFLAPAVIRAEARRSGVAYRRLLRRLALHGLLHLRGYHHEGSRTAAARFEARERRLLRLFSLA